MSEPEIMETPVRKAQHLGDRIGNDTHYEEDGKGSIEPRYINNDTEVRRSHQEWTESPIQDTKGVPRSKKVSKKTKNRVNNIGLLAGMTPSKILESAKKPVLSHTKSLRTPLNGKKTTNIDRDNFKKEKRSLEKIFSDDPKREDYEGLAISAQSDHENHTAQQRYSVRDSVKDSVMSNYDMIKQVDQGKEDIRNKKQRLKDLEEEILQISDKMTSYRNDTDLIIEELRERIDEREQVNQKIKEEPMFYTMNGNYEAMQQTEYSTSDELINILKTGIGNRNKEFIDSCKEDLQDWKTIIGREINAFNKFLQRKHKELTKDMAEEISSFTPVLNGKFDALQD